MQEEILDKLVNSKVDEELDFKALFYALSELAYLTKE